MRINRVSGSLLLFIVLGVNLIRLKAQHIPSALENVHMITTFGRDAPSAWGDDDHVQTYFFVVPLDWDAAVYLRVFDPDIGGAHDLDMADFNTSFKFSIYGGNGAYSDSASRQVDPIGNYRSGVLIEEKEFTQNDATDDKWSLLATVAPAEGELDNDLNGHVFKIIAEGLEGDDANLYKFYLSSSANENIPVIGSNAFAYELCFRPNPNPRSASHFYPFIKSNVAAVTLNNFDMDEDGGVWLNSVTKKNFRQKVSANDQWTVTKQIIKPPEHNTSLDYMFVGLTKPQNDMVIYFMNQYNEAIPFFSNPNGGAPKYGYKSDQQMIRRGDEKKEEENSE